MYFLEVSPGLTLIPCAISAFWIAAGSSARELNTFGPVGLIRWRSFACGYTLPLSQHTLLTTLPAFLAIALVKKATVNLIVASPEADRFCRLAKLSSRIELHLISLRCN